MEFKLINDILQMNISFWADFKSDDFQSVHWRRSVLTKARFFVDERWTGWNRFVGKSKGENVRAGMIQDWNVAPERTDYRWISARKVEYAVTCFSFDLFEFQWTNGIHLSLIYSNPIGLALIIEGNVEFIAKSAMILKEDNRQNPQLN